MRGLSVVPGKPGSAQLDSNWPEPVQTSDRVIVQTQSIGVCGTDREIISGQYGRAPADNERLIIGHECLGKVISTPSQNPFKKGDLVVPIVRRPDPVPCPNCAVGEWDMCRNGKYTEHGIKGVHGFCVERFSADPAFLIPVPKELSLVGSLVETASILAKAWEQIDYFGKRAFWKPKKALITGAGPVGLMAALFAKLRGLEFVVIDKVAEGVKPSLVKELGGTYHSGPVDQVCWGADIILECTGVGELVYELIECSSPNTIVCLTGVSSGSRSLPINFSQLNKNLVLENIVIFGSVNANRRHYEAAVKALMRADQSWLNKVITKRVSLERWDQAVRRDQQDVKNIIQLAE